MRSNRARVLEGLLGLPDQFLDVVPVRVGDEHLGPGGAEEAERAPERVALQTVGPARVADLVDQGQDALRHTFRHGGTAVAAELAHAREQPHDDLELPPEARDVAAHDHTVEGRGGVIEVVPHLEPMLHEIAAIADGLRTEGAILRALQALDHDVHASEVGLPRRHVVPNRRQLDRERFGLGLVGLADGLLGLDDVEQDHGPQVQLLADLARLGQPLVVKAQDVVDGGLDLRRILHVGQGEQEGECLLLGLVVRDAHVARPLTRGLAEDLPRQAALVGQGRQDLEGLVALDLGEHVLLLAVRNVIRGDGRALPLLAVHGAARGIVRAVVAVPGALLPVQDQERGGVVAARDPGVAILGRDHPAAPGTDLLELPFIEGCGALVGQGQLNHLAWFARHTCLLSAAEDYPKMALKSMIFVRAIIVR